MIAGFLLVWTVGNTAFCVLEWRLVWQKVWHYFYYKNEMYCKTWQKEWQNSLFIVSIKGGIRQKYIPFCVFIYIIVGVKRHISYLFSHIYMISKTYISVVYVNLSQHLHTAFAIFESPAAEASFLSSPSSCFIRSFNAPISVSYTHLTLPTIA